MQYYVLCSHSGEAGPKRGGGRCRWRLQADANSTTGLHWPRWGPVSWLWKDPAEICRCVETCGHSRGTFIVEDAGARASSLTCSRRYTVRATVRAFCTLVKLDCVRHSRTTRPSWSVEWLDLARTSPRRKHREIPTIEGGVLISKSDPRTGLASHRVSASGTAMAFVHSSLVWTLRLLPVPPKAHFVHRQSTSWETGIICLITQDFRASPYAISHVLRGPWMGSKRNRVPNRQSASSFGRKPKGLGRKDGAGQQFSMI